MYRITEQTIMIYWPRTELFRIISEESLYNAQSAENFDLATLTEDETPFFDDNMPGALATLSGWFRRVMRDGEVQITNTAEEIGLSFRARTNVEMQYSVNSLIALDSQALVIIKSLILQAWYMAKQNEPLFQNYRNTLAEASTSISDTLFRFIRPADNGRGYGVTMVVGAGGPGHCHPPHHGHRPGPHPFPGRPPGSMPLIGVRRMYLDGDRLVAEYTDGSREILGDSLAGKSAYEYAVEGGYTGNEREFYSDLAYIQEKSAKKLTAPVVIEDFNTFDPRTLGLEPGEQVLFISNGATGKPIASEETCVGRITCVRKETAQNQQGESELLHYHRLDCISPTDGRISASGLFAPLRVHWDFVAKANANGYADMERVAPNGNNRLFPADEWNAGTPKLADFYQKLLVIDGRHISGYDANGFPTRDALREVLRAAFPNGTNGNGSANVMRGNAILNDYRILLRVADYGTGSSASTRPRLGASNILAFDVSDNETNSGLIINFQIAVNRSGQLASDYEIWNYRCVVTGGASSLNLTITQSQADQVYKTTVRFAGVNTQTVPVPSGYFVDKIVAKCMRTGSTTLTAKITINGGGLVSQLIDQISMGYGYIYTPPIQAQITNVEDPATLTLTVSASNSSAYTEVYVYLKKI